MDDEKRDEVEAMETSSASSESLIDESDDEEQFDDEEEEQLINEPLTEKEVDELIAELLEVESKAAEAQEALEDESLAKVEAEVRDELSQTLNGEALEKAVEEEMVTLKDEWETTLDDLETESSHLLEQLDGAGIALESVYKYIENQAPNNSKTEAWKKRTHWVGTQITPDANESKSEAEKYLQTHRPVMKKLGKVLEQGASGFLKKKLESEDSDWNTFNKICCESSSKETIDFNSKEWATVYLASNPQQAADLGLKFPGVDEVEEIGVIGDDPFIADAIANEGDLYLSEEQKKNFRKVKEEDDANVDLKLQLRLKRRRHRIRDKEATSGEDLTTSEHNSNGKEEQLTNGHSSPIHEIDIDKENHHEPIIIDSDEETQEKSTKRKMSISPQHVNQPHNCTACGTLTTEVHAHPLLKVIVCLACKSSLDMKIDADVLDCYCGWCGKSGDYVKCEDCKSLFCGVCIKRNLGGEFYLQVQSSGWKCCVCVPSLVQDLALELEKVMEMKGLVSSSSESDSDSEDSDDSSDQELDDRTSSKRHPKKKIRRILDDTELGEETKRKIAIEKERQERLKSLGAQLSYKSTMMSSANSTMSKCKGDNIEVLGDASRGYIVNVVREEGEEAVRVPPSISAKLKPHQIQGIRFMWENIVQSIRRVRSGDKGLGCILAHTMGLGKTFQVIAFLYTAMRCVDLGLKTALIVTPVSVQHNWRHEFMKWKPSEFKALRVFMLDDVPRERRAELLTKWRTKGGIFLIGYTAFRNMSLGKHIKDRHVAREIASALQEGPDILVCDEAHIIKNTKADVTQALKQVKCQRRIALTGSPLQNNLMEYYCMVDFVREGFLGSSHEFRNRFQNPIENGQHTNSTAQDVKIMNQRSHILYEQLKGFVQRMDMNVVKKDLPPKTVYVVSVKLSSLQRKLYKRFLEMHGFTADKIIGEKIQKRSFWAGYQALAQIWNHPGILQLMKKNKDSGKREITPEVDDISSDENMDYNLIPGEKTNNNGGPHRKNDNNFLVEDWWSDLLQGNCTDVDHSGKMVLLLEILTMCCTLGDKALVFSQSLSTLDLIETYLSKSPRPGKKGKLFKKGKDWYRLDGRTESSERQRIVERFNEPSNKRVKCTLISTKAGSLGINLHAANRVIIVDGSWNPTYDLQAIFRVWRYGQTKPVFAYRLLAHGTMEEKIYKRQVTKESLAARVVDRQQVHRTISKEEMLHLFDLGDDENPDAGLGQGNVHLSVSDSSVSMKDKPSPADKLMQTVIGRHHPRWIANYHEHETLLQENEEERLSKEEQDHAWEVFRKSLEWEEIQPTTFDKQQQQKPVLSSAMSAPAAMSAKPPIQPSLARARDRRVMSRKCTNLSHLLTLRSQGTKTGCSTVCGECATEISWESIHKNGK